MFYNSDFSEIICNNKGEDCTFNLWAQDLFEDYECSSLFQIFPDIKLTKSSKKCNIVDCKNRTHFIQIKYFAKADRWLITIDRDTVSEWGNFMEGQDLLNDLYKHLDNCDNEKDIYKKVVEFGLYKLKLDRIGILLISIKDNLMTGSWGTDEAGNIADQSSFKSDLSNEQWTLNSIKNKNHVFIEHELTLLDFGKEIGKGWNLISAFFDGETTIGWIACDNLLTGKPLPYWKKNLLGELGIILGELVSKIRQETRLENIVLQTTNNLKNSLEDLIEAEKLVSLGSLVAGVSNEVDNPIESALNEVSEFVENIKEFQDFFYSGKVKNSDLSNFLEKTTKSCDSGMLDLTRVGQIVNNFKHLATDHTLDNKRDINLHELVNNIIVVQEATNPNLDLRIYNKIDKKLNIYANAGEVLLLFNHLFSNSITHGFRSQDIGIIYIDSKIIGDKLTIEYKDFGIGCSEDELLSIFKPFYSTNRSFSGGGLGLSIVHNIIVKLGGSISVRRNNPGLLFRFECSLDLLKGVLN